MIISNLTALKNTILLVGALAFSICAYAQPGSKINKTDSQGRKQGLWQKYYPTDTMQYQATFVNDKPVGELIRFYEDGSLQAIINYDADGVERAELFYPETGETMAQGNYINQKRDSIWLFFSDRGILTSSETYEKGLKNGLTTIYYTTGSVSEKITFKDDIKNGSWEQYFEDGTLKLKANVVDGIKFVGEYVSYYSNGKILQKGKFVDGLKHSSWYDYNEDGSIEIIYVYRFGKVEEEHPQNGVFDAYYPNDIKRSEYTYKNGKKHGPFKEYYQLGEWVTEEETDNFGNAYPVQRLYGTQVRREGKYKEGELNGEVIYYEENGKIDKKEVYNSGELID